MRPPPSIIFGEDNIIKKGDLKEIDTDKINNLLQPPEKRISNFEKEGEEKEGYLKELDTDKIMDLLI